MTPREFEFCTPREIYFALRSYADERNRGREFDLDNMRLQTMYIYNLVIPESRRIRDPRQLMKFKHDEEYVPEEDVYIPTPEEWDELDKRLAEMHEKTVELIPVFNENPKIEEISDNGK